MKSKALKITIVLAILALVSAFAFSAGDDDPNSELKDGAKSLTAGTSETVTYQYAYDETNEDGGTDETSFSYVFKPAESGTYDFSLSSIDGSAGIAVSAFLMDENMGDILAVTNVSVSGEGEEASCASSASGSAYLMGEQTYYITVNVDSVNETDAFAGSFGLTADLNQYAAEPEQAAEGQPATVAAAAEQQKCVTFRPESDGDYRIDCGFADPSSQEQGSTVVSSVVRSDGLEVAIADGVCHLEQGKEYTIWFTAFDVTGETADVTVNCTRLEAAEVSGNEDVAVNDNSVIHYQAEATGQMLVYSVSEGDPRATVYDSDGFQIGADDNAKGAFSENEKDFALVFNAEEGRSYKILVEGDPCQVKIEPYKGNGDPFVVEDEPEDPQDPTTPTKPGTTKPGTTKPGAATTKPAVKAANPMTAKGKTLKIKYKKLKKKKMTFKAAKAFKVRKARGKVTYKVTKLPKKARKKITVSKTGKVTVKKGLKKGTYKVRVKVTAVGNAKFRAKSKVVTLTIKVK